MSWIFSVRVTGEMEDPTITNTAVAETALRKDLGRFGQVEITELRNSEDEETITEND